MSTSFGRLSGRALPGVFGKFVRFGLVGLASTALYGILAVFLHAVTTLAPMPVHILAFAFAIPFSYLAQKGFAFRNRNRHADTLPRFILTAVVAFGLSSGAVYYATAVLGLHYLFGTFATMVLVPVANFLVLLLWVFAHR